MDLVFVRPAFMEGVRSGNLTNLFAPRRAKNNHPVSDEVLSLLLVATRRTSY
jgi:hypothetical protein